jgi:hypothetical protein
VAIVIGQIITETAAVPRPDAQAAPASGQQDDAQLELIVRRASERVMEQLRREWDR